jgi:hypothetical protein
MEYLERAFDDAKYGWYSQRPYIDCAIQSIVDPDMAPPGKHVMSCFVQYAPYHLKGSDWDTERERFGDTVQATLESFFPGFGDLVLHREIVTPLDIERVVGLSEGNIFAGEFFAPQMYFFRPAPGWSQYRTPIEGYYQCGSGTHSRPSAASQNRSSGPTGSAPGCWRNPSAPPVHRCPLRNFPELADTTYVPSTRSAPCMLAMPVVTTSAERNGPGVSAGSAGSGKRASLAPLPLREYSPATSQAPSSLVRSSEQNDQRSGRMPSAPATQRARAGSR